MKKPKKRAAHKESHIFTLIFMVAFVATALIITFAVNTTLTTQKLTTQSRAETFYDEYWCGQMLNPFSCSNPKDNQGNSVCKINTTFNDSGHTCIAKDQYRQGNDVETAHYNPRTYNPQSCSSSGDTCCESADRGRYCDNGFTCNPDTSKCEDIHPKQNCTFVGADCCEWGGSGRYCNNGLDCNPSSLKCDGPSDNGETSKPVPAGDDSQCSAIGGSCKWTAEGCNGTWYHNKCNSNSSSSYLCCVAGGGSPPKTNPPSTNPPTTNPPSYDCHNLTLKNGSNEPCVTHLQHDLDDLYGYQIPTTGYFGSITEDAVKDFQGKNGLDQTGVVDRKTWEKIHPDLASGSQPPPSSSPPVQPPSNQNSSGDPKGVVDHNTGSSIDGWAFDPDDSSKSIEVHIYIYGNGKSAIGYSTGLTSVDRPDVNKAYGITGVHGFKFDVQEKAKEWCDGKTYTADVFAINIGGGQNTTIGSGSWSCKAEVKISPTLTPAPTVTKTPSISAPITTTIATTKIPACPTRPAGDADCDGKFTLIDFEIWRKELVGELKTLTADFNDNGVIDSVDYTIWKKAFTSTQ